ncbi:MAG TPA: hypothetical protein VMF09_13000 [Solirubrobacteraceae bacterium]|nr:hypothetical protein [Solirubrobacteraceae bacterium]
MRGSVDGSRTVPVGGTIAAGVGGPVDARVPRRVAAPALRALLAGALLSLAIGSLAYDRASLPHAGAVATHARPRRALARAGLLSLPVSARAPVSAALGASDPAYRVTSAAGALGAANPSQRLSSRFTDTGASVSSGATRLGLRLAAAGYGSSLTALPDSAPSIERDRVVYQLPGLTEWYSNGPLGLEQGFTVARAPGRGASGPLTLAIALAGNSRPALRHGAQTISFSRAGHTVLRYTGLSATDAAGRPLHSWLALRAGRILLRVDAAGARYPLRIDPFVQVGKALAGEGEFGDSVALSGDGDTALVGAPVAKAGDGEALVFKRAGEKWTQEGEALLPEGETGAGFFGQAVALSANGDYALIGAPEDNGGAGAAWAFVRVGEKWQQQSAKLTGEGGEFGYSVALSGEGTEALVGSPFQGPEYGATWAFQRSGEKWTETQKLTREGGELGWSVAISPEGKTALISVPFKERGDCLPEESGPGRECGAVYVYSFNGVHSEWTYSDELVASGEDGEGFFGWSVALSREGSVALIGAPHEAATFPGNCAGKPVAPECEGAAYVFTGAGEAWSQQARLTGREETKLAEFGYSVALSANGGTALVGGRRDEEKVGAAWEFTRTGSAWTQRGAKITGSGESGKGLFGFTVALSEEGDVGLVGAPEDKERRGAVWTFEDAADTGAATEVTPKTATLDATVDPNGEEVSECKFEYGTSSSYGSTAPCVKSPGSGTSPVAVSASLTGLNEDATYHFRVSATNALGTHLGGDETFTTLQSSKSGSTKEAEKPAEASDGQLSVKASSGTGTITVGTYGSNPGGTRLLGSKGGYTDVYQSPESSFSKIDYKDCELNGATVLYWFDPQANLGGGAWQQVSRQTYLAGSPDCIEVEAEASGTSPTVSQLNGTRFGDAAQVRGPEFGRCAAAQSRKEAGKTVYEGYFSTDTCTALDEAKTGAPKGKYEWEVEVFAKAQFTTHLTSGVVTLQSASASSKVTCDAESSSGEYVGLRAIDGVVLTLTGCAKAGEKCSSAGRSAGEVLTSSLEGTLGVQKKGATSAKDKIALALYPVSKTGPFAEFSCGGTSVSVRGAVLVPIKAGKGYLKQALKFEATKGAQKPEGFEGEPKQILEESFDKGASYEQTGLTAAITQTNDEDVEVNPAW